jgi:fructose-specific phosphotransferase system IIC component
VALRFSIAFTISLSDFAEVEQTLDQAVTIFGALTITTGAFFDVDFVAIFLLPFFRLGNAIGGATGISVPSK